MIHIKEYSNATFTVFTANIFAVMFLVTLIETSLTNIFKKVGV
jgi:hypothetical protein